MKTVKIFPKESEREWFIFNFQGHNFKWNNALKEGIVLYTYNVDGLRYKYSEKCIAIEELN